MQCPARARRSRGSSAISSSVAGTKRGLLPLPITSSHQRSVPCASRRHKKARMVVSRTSAAVKCRKTPKMVTDVLQRKAGGEKMTGSGVMQSMDAVSRFPVTREGPATAAQDA